MLTTVHNVGRSESWVVASHFLCDLINLVNLPAPNSSVEGSSISSSERSKKFFELVLLTGPGGGGSETSFRHKQRRNNMLNY